MVTGGCGDKSGGVNGGARTRRTSVRGLMGGGGEYRISNREITNVEVGRSYLAILMKLSKNTLISVRLSVLLYYSNWPIGQFE